jgi:hypothetical protein
MSAGEPEHRIDRLMDAIDLIKADRHAEARPILQALISENGDFEDAWMWMSLAVDSLDQRAVCLDNVLRVNPNNSTAAGALYRLRYQEIEAEKTGARLRFWRDLFVSSFWLLVMGLLSFFMCNIYAGVFYWMGLLPLPTVTPTP